MELTQNLSKNMIAIRGRKTQAEFSKELGITKSTVQAIESQKSAVRLDTLEIICEHLELPAGALLSDELNHIEMGVLRHVLRRSEWFVKQSEKIQREYVDWLRRTAELFSAISDVGEAE